MRSCLPKNRLFMPRLVSERIKKLREEIAEISEANRTHKHRRDVGQPPTTNGGSNDCRKFWMSLMCGSQDLTLQAILSNGVATVRQTLRRMFSAMAAERGRNGASLCKRLVTTVTEFLVRH